MTIHILENDNLKVELIEFGASIYNLYLKIDNNFKSVLSTPNNLDDFVKNDLNHGRIIGRTAGMLYKEQLDNELFSDTTNNIMHGGKFGLANNKFSITNKTPSSITFEAIDDGTKNGYLANLEVRVTYELTNDQLIIHFNANATNDTLVSLTSHPYFNLTQDSDLSKHLLYVNADQFLKRNQNIPSGMIKGVNNLTVDFRNSKPVTSILDEGGLDHAYLLNKKDNLEIEATLKSGNIELNVYSTYPSTVIYTQNRSTIVTLNNNQSLNNKHSGIAIEPQQIQGSIPILRKDETYNHKIIYEIKQL